jgi:hypothetical protein
VGEGGGGGGGGSSFGPAGAGFGTAMPGVGASVSVLAVGPPSAVISSPAAGGNFVLGASVPTSFSCTDALDAPGLASCSDSHGASAPAGLLDTSTLGLHTYTVTATSKDGLTAAASITYSVVFPPPTVTVSGPSISGTRAQFNLPCNGLPGQSCAGGVLAAAQERKQGQSVIGVIARKAPGGPVKTVPITVARASYALPAGQSTTVTVALNATGTKLLAQFYKLPVDLTFTGTATVTRSITYSYPRVGTVVHGFWFWTCSGQECWTTVSRLTVDRLPAAATIKVSCRGHGCPFGHRVAARHGSQLAMASWFAGDRLAPGTMLEVNITAPNSVGAVWIYTMQTGKLPKRKGLCLPPGDRQPAACA